VGRLTSNMQHEAGSLSARLFAAWQSFFGSLCKQKVLRTIHSNLQKCCFSV